MTDYPWTPHELASRECFAGIVNASTHMWDIIRSPRPGVWYDWCDATTGARGQCKMNADGTWHQAPREDMPVILEWRG